VKSHLEEILRDVYRRKLTPEDAVRALGDFPYQDLEFAKVDHHREVRKGFPEIIYGLGKTDAQILGIAREIVKKKGNLLITRIGPAAFRKIKKAIPGVMYNEPAKAAYLKIKPAIPGKGQIVILTAGTSDISVAEEASVTCDMLGNDVRGSTTSALPGCTGSSVNTKK